MLGDRTRALGDFALAIVGECGPEDSHVIDPIVIIEPIVFGCDDGLREHFRQALIGDWLAVLDEELSELASFPVVKNGSGFHFTHLLEIEFLGALLIAIGQNAKGYPACKSSQCQHDKGDPEELRLIKWPSHLLCRPLPTVIFLADRRHFFTLPA